MFRNGPLTANQAAKLNEMARQLDQLARLSVSAPLGLSRAGGIPVITAPGLQGFPAELTSTFDAATGYDWTRCRIDRSGANPSVETDPQTGSYAFTPDNNEDLAVGDRGWLSADPNSGGWIFLPEVAASSSGITSGNWSPRTTSRTTTKPTMATQDAATNVNAINRSRPPR